MSRDGSGNYSLYSGNPVTTGATISSTLHNNTMNDIATALTASIAKDGQTVPSADLPMGTYKHTGVGNASARTQYAAAGQVQDGTLEYLTSVSGADTITAAAVVSMAAYAAGQTFRFIAAGANTGAVTININAIGAKAITKNGTTALAAGDIPSGATVEIVYDGTRFQMIGCVANKAQAGANTDITSLAGLTTPLASVYGGTGEATLSAAVQALLDTLGTTEGDLIYHDGTDWVVLAKGDALQQLRRNAGNTAMEWADGWAETSEYAMPAAGATTTIPHGLGAVPLVYQVYLRVKVDDGHGWAVGDDIPVHCAYGSIAIPVFQVRADATNVYVTAYNGSATFGMVRPVDGVATAIALASASYKLVVKARL